MTATYIVPKRLGRSFTLPTKTFVTLILPLVVYSVVSSTYFLARISVVQPNSNDNGMPTSTSTDSDSPQQRQSRFTVVINTHRDSLRNPCVIGQWLPLQDIIQEIIVVWDNPTSLFYDILSMAVANYSIPVRFIDNLEKASLNNRYTIYDEIHTDGVFAIDDDIRIRHGGVRAAFEEWKRHPDLMINYSRQDVAFNEETTEYSYQTHWPSNFNRSSTLGLTMAGGTMVHQRYYELYSKEVDAMAFVDAVHNGEDILMNWVIAKDLRRRNITNMGTAVFLWPFFPSFPNAPLPENYTKQSSAISQGPNHYQSRTACVRKFVEIFGFALTESNNWSVGWMLPSCTMDFVGCRFPFGDEPRLNTRTCKYSLDIRIDVYE